MSVLERDAFFERIQNRVGEDTSDEALQFIEDMTDTYNDLETRATGDGVDWEQRYKDLDEQWKKKYKHRFFSAGGNVRALNPDEEDEDEVDKTESITYKDLFED